VACEDDVRNSNVRDAHLPAPSVVHYWADSSSSLAARARHAAWAADGRELTASCGRGAGECSATVQQDHAVRIARS